MPAAAGDGFLSGAHSRSESESHHHEPDCGDPTADRADRDSTPCHRWAGVRPSERERQGHGERDCGVRNHRSRGIQYSPVDGCVLLAPCPGRYHQEHGMFQQLIPAETHDIEDQGRFALIVEYILYENVWIQMEDII